MCIDCPSWLFDLKIPQNGGFTFNHNSKLSLFFKVKSKQNLDPVSFDFKELVLSKTNDSLSQGANGVQRYQCILCVPDVDDLRKLIF